MIRRQASHLLGRILLGTVLAVSCSIPIAKAGPVIGTFDASRTGVANVVTGIFSTQANASLLANFPGHSYLTTPTLTPAFLGSIDILFIHPINYPTGGITPLSAGEQTALFNYVAGGGNALLLLEGGMSNPTMVVSSNSIAGVFGLTLVDDGLTGILNGTPTAPSHPILSGPFGTQTSVQLGGAGVYTNLGPYAQSVAKMDALNLPVIAVIEAGAIAPGSGRVILTSDVEMFVDTPAGYFPTHQTLHSNMIAWLNPEPIPEPSSLVLATVGGLLGGAFLVRRRRVRR